MEFFCCFAFVFPAENFQLVLPVLHVLLLLHNNYYANQMLAYTAPNLNHEREMRPKNPKMKEMPSNSLILYLAIHYGAYTYGTAAQGNLHGKATATSSNNNRFNCRSILRKPNDFRSPLSRGPWKILRHNGLQRIGDPRRAHSFVTPFCNPLIT